MIRIGFLFCLAVATLFGRQSLAQTNIASRPDARPRGEASINPSAANAALTNSAQSTAGATSSALTVTELTSMLRMIDPYKPSSTPVQGSISVYGSTAMDAMAHLWSEQIRQFYPKLSIEISAAGSGDAFAKLREKPDSVAMLSRPVTADELAKLKSDKIKQPVAFVVGREALAVYVHASNPAASISGEQLRMVFTKQLEDQYLMWKLLGVSGPMADQPIRIISRVETSGTQAFLRDTIFSGMPMRGGESSLNSNNDVLSSLAQDPLAITICGLRASATSVRVLPLVLDGVAIPAGDASVLSGRYPLTRSLTLVIDLGQTGPNAHAAQQFVLFALSQLGQIDAIRAGFFPADFSVLRAGLDRLQQDRAH